MNLVKSTGTFGFYTIISRLLGYLRDVLIAIFLGTSFLADAFFVAFRIPNTFRRLFAEGTFNSAFVPSYTSELVKNKSRSNKFANDVFNLLFLALFFLVLIIEIFMPIFVGLIAPGFIEDTKKFELATALTRITFPFLMFVSLSSFFGAILNSHNKFAAASAAPIILNIVLITILFFGRYLGDELIYYLSYGVSIAGLLQLIFLYRFVKKYYALNFDFKFKITNKVKFFFKKLLPSIFSSGVTQINILVGTIIASFQASAVSYLYYADRIYQINLAIAGIAIGTILLPNLSKHINSKKDSFEGNTWIAKKVIPKLSNANVLRSWAAMSVDVGGYPLLGEHPLMKNFYVVVSSNGYTLGPILGPLAGFLFLYSYSKDIGFLRYMYAKKNINILLTIELIFIIIASLIVFTSLKLVGLWPLH